MPSFTNEMAPLETAYHEPKRTVTDSNTQSKKRRLSTRRVALARYYQRLYFYEDLLN